MDKKVIEEEITQYFEQFKDNYLAHVSIDTVIFSFHEEKLNVLLLNYTDVPCYCLPGGYIRNEEDIDDAALRILKERTGMENIYLDQFYTTGKANRVVGSLVLETIRKITGNNPAFNWFEQRFVSICYYAIIDETKVSLKTEPLINDYRWMDVQQLPQLLFDHNFIIAKAIAKLQADLDQKLIASNLLNETFTMGQLQKLYEAVFQKKFARNNFQRKMLSLDILERLDKHFSGKAHKAPYLYRFKDKE